MAKNLFEQFLDFASSKLAGPIAHENIYREESTELSSVAKYIARQELAAKAREEAEAASAPKATSVEKYLARQAALAEGGVQSAPAASESVQEPLTGVAKYLAGQYKAVKTAAPAPAPAPAPEPEPTTSVGRYLAGQSRSGTAQSGAVKEPAPVAKPAAKAEAVVEPVKEKVAPHPFVEPSKTAASTSKPSHADDASKTGAIIHLNDGKQCQASTTKGTQCKHTSNLGHIQRTINKQKYMFSVCNQHHNETFKPFAPLLEKTSAA
ncbi:MAG: hypothetical protein ACU841_04495 [Gammaproteobacteria bacterium]